MTIILCDGSRIERIFLIFFHIIIMKFNLVRQQHSPFVIYHRKFKWHWFQSSSYPIFPIFISQRKADIAISSPHPVNSNSNPNLNAMDTATQTEHSVDILLKTYFDAAKQAVRFLNRKNENEYMKNEKWKIKSLWHKNCCCIIAVRILIFIASNYGFILDYSTWWFLLFVRTIVFLLACIFYRKHRPYERTNIKFKILIFTLFYWFAGGDVYRKY